MPSISQSKDTNSNANTNNIGGDFTNFQDNMDQLTTTSAYSMVDLERTDTPQNSLLTGMYRRRNLEMANPLIRHYIQFIIGAFGEIISGISHMIYYINGTY